LKVTLRDIDPPIWRRLLVPDDTTLAQLHLTLQELFGWQNYHLYQFSIHDQAYEAPSAEAKGRSATTATLKSLKFEKGDRFEYWYDFGDDWLCDIVVEDASPAAPDAIYPSCIGGARSGPPEDCGGSPGYQELLRVLAHPKDPRYAELKAWVGPDFDSEAFDQRTTNRLLQLVFHGAQSNQRLKLTSAED
jgi:hypothetical protein